MNLFRRTVASLRHDTRGLTRLDYVALTGVVLIAVYVGIGYHTGTWDPPKLKSLPKFQDM